MPDRKKPQIAANGPPAARMPAFTGTLVLRAIGRSVHHLEFGGRRISKSRRSRSTAERPLFEPSIMEKLLSAEQIDEGVGRLAEEIFTFYSGQPVTIVGILNGSIMLLADLIRRLDMPLRIALVQASSYRETTESGTLRLDMSMLPEIRGRQVLLVDDIFDTGNTLAALVEQVRQAGAASVRTVVLLRKHGRKAVSMEPDHVGFEIPNQFVVGYGLDYRDMYRNLPYVAVLAEADL
jgi:hypoxanthine phosphoribosyltransferase